MPGARSERIVEELSRLFSVVRSPGAADLHDATEARGLVGVADAVVAPASTEEVVDVLRWCYSEEVPVIPRGGGTGFAGGCVPLEGGVVLSLERMNRVRSLGPLQWRMEVEAGVTTERVQRLARENGLFFPPDPGAAEQSQIGGNIATNAGGPHAFKYGVTGAWVTGLEVVVPPGAVLRVGGPIRKDVAGYDLKSLFIGSEGTLGVITAAWLRLIPAPEAALPIIAWYGDVGAGCAAIEAVMASGIVPSALEYLDRATLECAGQAFPHPMPEGAALMLMAEADGSLAEAEHGRAVLAEVLADAALGVWTPTEAEVRTLWRWRDGVSIAVTTRRGGKLSEDIVVPVDRLSEAIEATLEIGRQHGLETCSWGHAGDGNLHSTLMLATGDRVELTRAEHAAEELFALAIELGGSISGEHGLGVVKNDWLRKQWAPSAVELHRKLKLLFDPAGLLNPGKKLP